jgi:hypothetical protein
MGLVQLGIQSGLEPLVHPEEITKGKNFQIAITDQGSEEVTVTAKVFSCLGPALRNGIIQIPEPTTVDGSDGATLWTSSKVKCISSTSICS